MSKQLEVLVIIYAFATSLVLANLIFVINAQDSHKYPLSNRYITTSNNLQQGEYGDLVYGFLPYWMLENSKYLQYDKLTDIAYFGVKINQDGTLTKINDNNSAEPGYAAWQNSALLQEVIEKSKENNVRVSLTIISHNDDISTSFLMCRSCWETFVNELSSELLAKNISGVNFDFEYEGYVDSEIRDRYTQFISYANGRLKEQNPETFVVVSTYADSAVKSRLTNIEDLAKVSDKLFIMAYDFHYIGSSSVGPVAPIGGASQRYSYDLTVMLKDYLKNIPPNKLIMGVAYYGYNWVTESPDTYAKRLEGNDQIGLSTPQNYLNVKTTLLETNARVLWNYNSQSPYFTYISPTTGVNRVVHFENTESLKIKYALAKQNRLAGIGIWALGYDGEHPELWELLR